MSVPAWLVAKLDQGLVVPQRGLDRLVDAVQGMRADGLDSTSRLAVAFEAIDTHEATRDDLGLLLCLAVERLADAREADYARR